MIRNMAAPMWLQTEFQPFLLVLILLLDALKNSRQSDVEVVEDILDPYLYGHGPTQHQHRHTRAIQPPQYGNITHELYRAHTSSTVTLPIVETIRIARKQGDYYWDQKLIEGHFFYIHNPAKTVSIIEPNGPGGCENKRPTTVVETAETRDCILAINAGFFNRTDGSCLGDVVTDGKVVQYSGIQNAHFGIRKDGALLFGYLPENPTVAEQFNQLVSGVVWLVRDGKNYVDVSLKTESSETQETGSLQYFIDVQSARTTVGCDKEGRLIVGHIEGKTGDHGVLYQQDDEEKFRMDFTYIEFLRVDLHDFADLLIEMGVVNAVNLDGGGSATAVVNGTLVNYPSDTCASNSSGLAYHQCDRAVTTVLCVHEPSCEPHMCSGHGDCVVGMCRCHGRWTGIICDQLQCGVTNCTQHGVCQEDGCACHPGWYGESCEDGCPAGWYGYQCRTPCQCIHASSCDPEDGWCTCLPGYAGILCDQKCPHGFYGDGCHQLCLCDRFEHSCGCHHVTGRCNVSTGSSGLMQVAQCLTKKYIADHNLVASQEEQYRFCVIAVSLLCILCLVSLTVNVVLLCRNYDFRCTQRVRPHQKTRGKQSRPLLSIDSDADASDTDENEEEASDASDKKDVKTEYDIKNNLSKETNIPLLF